MYGLRQCNNRGEQKRPHLTATKAVRQL
jgi:hypothetical protein